MIWFKFYGKDFMTDPKIRRLNPIHQLMWVYLLCYASDTDNGLVKYVDEKDLIAACGISTAENDNLMEVTDGFFTAIEKMGMIEISEDGIQLLNYSKRQETNLSGAERAKRYREKHKPSDDNNTPSRDDSNARIEKIRKEEIINNGSATAPQVKKNETMKTTNGMSSIKDVLARRSEPVFTKAEEKIIRVHNAWQEKALRYADDLKLVLAPKAMGRWMKMFKQADGGRNAANIDKAYSFIVDYPKPLSNEEKMMFFFKIYERGLSWMNNDQK